MPRYAKPQIVIPAVIVALVAVAAGVQLWAQRQARANLDSLLASLPPGSTGHYDHFAYNAFTRTLRVGRLRIDHDGHPSFTVREAVVHHLSGRGELDTPFHTNAVRLQDVAIWNGAHSLTVALVQASNVDVLAPNVPPPPDTPSWLIAPASGTLLNAASISASGVADDEGATVSAVSVRGYHAGRLQQASARHFADSHGDVVAMVEADDIDLGRLDRVFDTGRYTPGAPSWIFPRVLIGHASLDGLESNTGTADATINNVSLDGFAARPFTAAPGSAYVKTAAFARDAAEGVSVESFGLTNLQFHDNQTKTAVTLGGLALSGYADGALARFTLDALAMTGRNPAETHLGHLALTGLTATRLLHEPADASAGTLIAAAESGAVRLAGLSLAQFSVTFAGSPPVAIGSLSSTVTGSDPIENSLRLQGLSIPAKISPELAAGLGPLGIDPLQLDLVEDGRYAPHSGDLAIRQMVLTAQKLGRLSFAGQFTNLPRAMPEEPDSLAALSGTGIGPFTLRFTNETLLQRVLALQARQSGKTPGEITDQVKLAAAFAAAALAPGQPDAGTQMAAFVAEPGTLTITAAPATPVPLGAFLGAQLNAAKAALNLHLSAEPPPAVAP